MRGGRLSGLAISGARASTGGQASRPMPEKANTVELSAAAAVRVAVVPRCMASLAILGTGRHNTPRRRSSLALMGSVVKRPGGQ